MYKCVFTCPELKERVFWYVSNRREAEKMVRGHICRDKGRPLPRYRDLERGTDYFVKIERVFRGYDGNAPETFQI